MAEHWIRTLLVICVYLQVVIANVEKVIFLGPSALIIPQSQPTLDDLQLHVLSSRRSTLRTDLKAAFPSKSANYGHASWFLLEYLNEDQRYEVRVCWAATQPTSFRLRTYEIPEVFGSKELITSLAEFSSRDLTVEYSHGLSQSLPTSFRKFSGSAAEKVTSMLFLEIYTAADYYTSNVTLMENVPPVLVDIILDPFIYNVLPQSLLPTAGYIVLLATASWYLARFIAKWFQMVARTDGREKNV